jgi:hypothetical protein
MTVVEDQDQICILMEIDSNNAIIPLKGEIKGDESQEIDAIVLTKC